MVDLKDKTSIPFVSISCMTYNHALFLRKCLDSFLVQQTNFPFEIIIHDDASTDGTRGIIAEYVSKYPDLIIPFIQKENLYSKGIRGLSTRFNYPRCRGRYIAICEGDDYWTDPLQLQQQVDFLEAHDEYVLTFHDFRIVDEQGKVMDENPLPIEQQKDASRKDLILGNRLTMTLTLCFRNVIKDFPPEKYKVTNGDTFLISMLGNYGKGKWMGDEIEKACYRSHSGGVWSMLGNKAKIPAQINTYYWLYRYYLRLGKIGYAINWYIKILYVKLTRKAGRLGSG
jgi:glycosyltransferase involved in cell wall biosynthesis